jgi:rhamnosyltransferase
MSGKTKGRAVTADDAEAAAGPVTPVERIAAVVTAYHPDARLAAVVEAALGSCVEVIVVDNTPEGSDSESAAILDERVRVLRSGQNHGLAGALNIGIRRLSDDIDAVLFLDQDSVLTPDVVHALAAHLSDPTIGMATPTPWDEAHGKNYETFSGRHSEVSDRVFAITSGMLVRRGLLDVVGEFREEFFVDYVDLEYSLRLRRTGARIVQDKRIKLPHSIGERREHRFLFAKVLVTHHPAWRHYWTARNGQILTREQFRHFPGWGVTNMLFIVRCAVQSALFEDGRRTHVKALLRGFRDGVRGKVSLEYLPTGAQRFTEAPEPEDSSKDPLPVRR